MHSTFGVEIELLASKFLAAQMEQRDVELDADEKQVLEFISQTFRNSNAISEAFKATTHLPCFLLVGDTDTAGSDARYRTWAARAAQLGYKPPDSFSLLQNRIAHEFDESLLHTTPPTS